MTKSNVVDRPWHDDLVYLVTRDDSDTIDVGPVDHFRWRANVLLAGANQTWGDTDVRNDIARRLQVFRFDHALDKKLLSSLDQQLSAELPRIIHKCNRYYLAAACHYGVDRFEWPAYFS